MASRRQLAGATVAFSSLAGWYGFMFGRESARRELEDKIRELKDAVAALEAEKARAREDRG